jgi:isopentenyl-diphosphate delta-isomerase
MSDCDHTLMEGVAVTATASVVLLSDDGTVIGTAGKAVVHGVDTPLHLAFSCYLFDAKGRVLLTRRSLEKLTWPGVWTNSFCGHPAPGETMADAIRRHARNELGVTVSEPVSVLPDFRYRAIDASGVVENEICPVFTARTEDAVLADPSEVSEWAWVAPEDLIRTVAATPQVLSPWSVLQVPRIHEALRAGGRA